MKKLSMLLAAALIALFAIFAMGSGEDSSDKVVDQGNGVVDQGGDQQGAADSAGSASNLGDYAVEIESCRLAEDYEGKDVVIVKYKFTNVSDDDPAAFWLALDDTVFQNGVGLNEAYFVDDSANYSSDNQQKEIKKGASIEVEVAYELNDTTTPVEVEVRESFSLDDDVVTKTFTIE